MPLIKKQEALTLLASLFPGYTFEQTLTHAPKQAAWRYMLFASFLAIIPVGCLCYFVPHGYGYFSLILLALLALIGFMQYRSTGLAVSGRQLTLVTRGISKQTFYVMKNRIQTLMVAQSIFAENGQLARLSVSIVAGKLESRTTLRFFEKQTLMNVFKWFQPHEKRG